MKMTRIKRLSLVLALLPIACGDSSTADESRGTDSSTPTETGTSDSNTETGTDSVSTSGDGDGDGDPTTTSGDGDGDPTTTTSGDGDGDATTTGDGDGDPTTSGDGDGDATTTGDGDGDGDGDATTTGDGDGDGPLCGNGMIDDGEECDDGNNVQTDACTNACVAAFCGDGFVQEGVEDCDDGNNEPVDGCDPMCNEEACVDFEVVLQPTPPNVMLVLDKSRSMFTNTWDHDNNNGTPDITRWRSLHNVVSNLLGTFDDQIHFGSILFPSTQAQNVYGPAACITNDLPEVTCGANNGPAILGAIPAANVVNSYGGTPAYLGVQTAYDHLGNLNPDNPPFMILVTDGAANCDQGAQSNFELFEVYDDNLPIIVGNAFADGIPTYVVGIDIANAVIDDGLGGDPNNINPAMKLNEVAQEGGTNQFFNSQDQGQLEAALNEILANVQSCIIPLEEEPFFPEFTKIVVNNVEYSYDQNLDCQNEDGWVYTNPNGPYDAIELCGAACDDLKQTGEADVQYFCNPG